MRVYTRTQHILLLNNAVYFRFAKLKVAWKQWTALSSRCVWSWLTYNGATKTSRGSWLSYKGNMITSEYDAIPWPLKSEEVETNVHVHLVAEWCCSLSRVVFYLHVQAGRRKHLAAQHEEDQVGQGRGNLSQPQAKCRHLTAREKSSEYHHSTHRYRVTIYAAGKQERHLIEKQEVGYSWSIRGGPLNPSRDCC